MSNINVASFSIDHDKLLRGVYVSRRDEVSGGCVTTYDIRMRRPNQEPPMEMAAIHTLEHLLAINLRSPQSGIEQDVVYVGPMGCRTGMYLLLKGERSPQEVVPVLKAAYKYVLDFEGDVPAATSAQCGNYQEHNLFLAKWEAAAYYEVLGNIQPQNLEYPAL